MPTPEAENYQSILVTGATGYIGGRLIPLLEAQGSHVRCLARDAGKLRPRVNEKTEIVQGDVLNPASLDEALRGIHTGYYLVHLMAGSKD